MSKGPKESFEHIPKCILIEVKTVGGLPLEGQGPVPIVCVETPLCVAHGPLPHYTLLAKTAPAVAVILHTSLVSLGYITRTTETHEGSDS